MQTIGFSRARVRFDAPQAACPGETFPIRFALENDTPVELPGSSLILGFDGCAPVLDTVFIDGVPTASDSLARAENGYLLRTPILQPGERIEVGLHVAAPLPFASEAVFVSYELYVPGEKLTDRRAIATPQTVLFEPRFCLMRIDGDREIARGEARRVRFRVRNTGSSIARDVTLDVRATGMRVDRLEQVGTLIPGERRDIEAIVVADGGRKKNLSIAPALVWPGGSLDLGEAIFEQVAEASFDVASTLRYVSDQPLSPRGGIYDIAITLKNIGKRPAVAPVVHLDLPPGTEMLAGQEAAAADCTIPFPDIPGGETRERIVHLKSRATESLQLRANVADFVFAPLTVPVNIVNSLSVERVDAVSEVTVGETLPVTIDVLNDGNGTLAFAQLLLRHVSPHLRYVSDSLTVNGSTVPQDRFLREGVLGFRNVQPGALMSIGFAFEPGRPTLHGQLAGVGLQIRWPGGERNFELPAITIRPAKVQLGSLFQLDDGEPIVDDAARSHVFFGEEPGAESAEVSRAVADGAAALVRSLEAAQQQVTKLPGALHAAVADTSAGKIVDGQDYAAAPVATNGKATILPDLQPVNSGITYFDQPDDAAHEGRPLEGALPDAVSPSQPEEAPEPVAAVAVVHDAAGVRNAVADFAQDASAIGVHEIIVRLLFPQPLENDGYAAASERWAKEIDNSETALVDPATFLLSEAARTAIIEATGATAFPDAVAALAPAIAAGYPSCRTAVREYILAVADAHRNGTSAKLQLDSLLQALAA